MHARGNGLEGGGFALRASSVLGAGILAAVLAVALACPAALAETKTLDLGEPSNSQWRRAMRQDKSLSQNRTQTKGWTKSDSNTKFKPDTTPSAEDQAKPRALVIDEEEQRAKAKPQVGVTVSF